MALQGRHQTWSGLLKINSGLLEGQGEEEGVCGLKGTDLQVQLPSPLPTVLPWLCRLRQCLCPTSACAILQGQSIMFLLLGAAVQSAGTVPALSLAVLPGAQGLTALQTRVRVPDAPWQRPGVSGCLEGGRAAGYASTICCPDGQALAQEEERCITLLSLQLHHWGVWAFLHHCALRHLTEGKGEGKEQQVPPGDRRGFRLYPFIVCQ